MKYLFLLTFGFTVLSSCSEGEEQLDGNHKETSVVETSSSEAPSFSKDFDNLRAAIVLQDKATVLTYVSNDVSGLRDAIELSYDIIFDQDVRDKFDFSNYQNLNTSNPNEPQFKELSMNFKISVQGQENDHETWIFFYFEETSLGLRIIDYRIDAQQL